MSGRSNSVWRWQSGQTNVHRQDVLGPAICRDASSAGMTTSPQTAQLVLYNKAANPSPTRVVSLFLSAGARRRQIFVHGCPSQGFAHSMARPSAAHSGE